MLELRPFPGEGTTDIALLGGKGASLVRMIGAGLPVPSGVVLTTAFFGPWFAELEASRAWKEVVAAGPEGWAATCPLVKALANSLKLNDRQTRVLASIELRGLLAVRSSSPEEDLKTASFAGGYETRLGVTRAGLLDAIRTCFASSLDARVLSYKNEHGFDPLSPSIAVVVQEQLDSEVAGVAFSIHPLHNDYDEAVIDACWGLGEPVVAGLTEPDHFVVHKPDTEIVERRRGDKKLSLWLTEQGTEQRRGHRCDELCLSDEQVVELTEMLGRVEAYFSHPVDIEWAWAAGQLQLLQARPVTAWVPLPAELRTSPGERRRLYMDASLSNGLTLNVPVSPLGLDWLEEVFTTLLERFVGPIDRDTPLEDSLFLTAGGRLYANLSHLLWTSSPAQLKRSNQSVDALMAEIMGAINVDRYRSIQRPASLGLGNLTRAPGLIWAARKVIGRFGLTVLVPQRALRWYHEDITALEQKLEALDTSATVEELLREGFDELFDTAFPALWGALGVYGTALFALDALGTGLDRELVMRMQQGFAGNVVVEMGMELHRLARLIEPELEGLELAELGRRIEQRADLPEAFLQGWDAFLERHGHRGPIEMDLASPRYADDPLLALSQMAVMVGGTEADPADLHGQLVSRRNDAVQALLDEASFLRRGPLRMASYFLGLYAGTRDTPKHVLTLYNYVLRRSALREGRQLVEEGRLDAPEHIFDLHLADLTMMRADATLDLRALRRHNSAFLQELREAAVVFPPVIDSRGRILRPPPSEETPGELRGMGVSVGVATGRVRLLHTPDGAAIRPGEVLVAYTTDPGWTPLFLNAAAVVLEIGGTLQHGALVAREYGKPCVVGVSRLLERLEDGQLVEVDGLSGTVRLLASPGAKDTNSAPETTGPSLGGWRKG